MEFWDREGEAMELGDPYNGRISSAALKKSTYSLSFAGSSFFFHFPDCQSKGESFFNQEKNTK